MMALTEDNRVTGEGAPAHRRILLGLALGFVVLFAGAVALGAAVALVEGARSPIVGIALLVAALAFAVAAGWRLVRIKPWTTDGEPLGPRTRKARQMLMLSVVLGAVLGALLSAGTIGVGGPAAVFSDAPVPPLLAAGALAIWLIVVPPISWIWLRTVDEHEVAAYNLGGVVAAHLYLFALPAWWLAWRGGFVPQPQHGTLFAAVAIAWLLGWAWRRYR